MKKSIIKVLLCSVLTGGILTSCADSGLDPTLEQQIDINVGTKSFSDLQTVLNGGYDRMQAAEYYGRDLIIFGEVRSDNAYSNANSNRFVTPGQMNMLTTDAYPLSLWTQIYRVVANANVVINRIDGQATNAIDGASPADINHLKGEALTMRALAHFDALRVFGQQFVNNGGMAALGVPLVDHFRDVNEIAPPRATVQQSYDKIMADLDAAIGLMNPGLDDMTNHYLNSIAAHAIKARVANYFKKYDVAYQEAKFVVDSGKYSISNASSFINTFVGGTAKPNVIFSIAMRADDNLGNSSLAQIYHGSAYGDISILQNLVSIYTPGDVRGSSNFIIPDTSHAGAYRNIGKYPNVATPSDDVPVIRYEEIVLIYAEALLNKSASDPANALIQLNSIPAKRNAPIYTVATNANILLERRKELAFEGFRFDDIARNGMAMPLVDPIRQAFGNVPAGSFKFAFPIPQAEMTANGTMIQNNGYQ